MAKNFESLSFIQIFIIREMCMINFANLRCRKLAQYSEYQNMKTVIISNIYCTYF